MKVIAQKIEEVIIGNNEAGLYEYQDTGVAIEMGDKAFTIRGEDVFFGGTKTLYFKKRENAEKYN